MDLEKLDRANYLTKQIPKLERDISSIHADNFWVAYRDISSTSQEKFSISSKLRLKLKQLLKEEFVFELEKAKKEFNTL